MSFKKRFLAGALAAVMTLGMTTGCTTVRKSDLSDDYSTVAAATYGDETIYLDEVNYYLRNRQLMYEYYYSMMGAGADIWSDTKMEDALREEVLSAIYQTKVLCAHAADYKVELTEEEKKLVKESVDNALSEDNADFLEVAGSDEQMLTDIMTENALANKVYHAISSAAEITTKKEDVVHNSVSYLLFSEEPKKSEDKTEGETEASSETKEEKTYYKEADANAALKKIQGGTSIKDVAKELNMEVTDNNFGVKEEQTSELSKAAVALKKGESTVVYKEGTGWYVVICNSENDEDATEEAYKSAVEKEKTEHFNEVYKEMDKEKFKVNEDVIKTLNIKDTKLIKTETEEESSADETTAEN